MGRKQVFSFHVRIGEFMRRTMALAGLLLIDSAHAQTRQKAPAKTGLASIPSEITYRGSDKLPNGTPALNWVIQFKIVDGKITGTSHTTSINGRQPPFRGTVTGTFRNGQCTVTTGGLTLSGLCNDDMFSGIQMGGTTTYGSFTFYNVLTEDRQLAARAAEPQPSIPANTRATPPIFKMDLPDTTGRTGTHGAENGWFDYVEGDDEPEEEPQRDQGSGGYDSSGSGGNEGLPAPAGTVWAYGRNRWVIQPGGRCGPESQLVKGYCFGAVIAYMRRSPKVKSVVAITLSHPAPLGTWISRDTPIRYGYVEVYRNKDGNGFNADKHNTGVSKVKTPLGCHYSPLKEGFILAGPGPQGLQEAALFRCP